MAKAKPVNDLEHDAPICDAALRRAFGLLGKRWNGLVVAVLGGGPVGFADLRRRIGPISDSVLSDRLTELAEAGLVARCVTDSRPPGVQYGLTPAGAALVPVLEQIATWAGDHLEQRLDRAPDLL
jgi:DNA-binding HxlR family transcriptional regulator